MVRCQWNESEEMQKRMRSNAEVAHIVGSYQLIAKVVEQRAEDPLCEQLPLKVFHPRANVDLLVVYEVRRHQSIFVRDVLALLNGEWVPLYIYGCERQFSKGGQNFHYLDRKHELCIGKLVKEQELSQPNDEVRQWPLDLFIGEDATLEEEDLSSTWDRHIDALNALTF